MIPTTISHYRILEQLGEGGMGDVYLAEDTILDRKVALKFLSEALEEDTSAKKRFLREAKSAAAIEHPYVCQIFEIGESQGRSYIAMEHVAGRTLKEELGGGPIPVDKVLVIASEIAEGLEEAHRMKVVHRDLKPANIMLTPGGHVKVMDFGLAKQLSDDDAASGEETLTRLTEEGSTLGTLAYMSPEQLRGEEVDPRSDIFSFGLVLYEMVAGAHPFRRPTRVETSSAILDDAPPPLTRYTEGVPELLAHLVRKMLAKDPEERYQSVHEVRTELAELLHAGSSATVTEAVAPGPRRALGWRAGVALVALLAVAGVLVWLTSERRPAPLEAGEITSLAVLPFDNLMGDPEQQYFVDGMHDAVITELSRIGALRVISRTSVNRYRDTEDSLEEIAGKLGVDALIEGTVLRSENAVRITAQLMGVRPERHLWANHFERDLEDVLALQSEVARAIAERIQITLSPRVESQLASFASVPPEAYDAYLKGRHFADQLGEEALRKAESAFERAIAEAPDWAQPHAGLAELHRLSAQTGQRSPMEALTKAKDYALKALELDDSLAEPHLTLANLDLGMDWNWAGAEQDVRRTLELNPNSAEAHKLYSRILLITARNELAVEELQKTMALEPLAHRFMCSLGYYHYVGRRYEEAIDASLRSLEVWGPICPAEDLTITLSYVAKGMPPEAVASADDAVEQFDRIPALLAAQAEAYAAAGRRTEADKILAELESLAEEKYVDPMLLAAVHTRLGNHDAAFDMLERAYELRSPWLPDINIDPRLDPLRDDPRFDDILRRIGLKPDQSARRLRPRGSSSTRS